MSRLPPENLLDDNLKNTGKVREFITIIHEHDLLVDEKKWQKRKQKLNK